MGANLDALLGPASADPHGPVPANAYADQGINGSPVPAPSGYAQGVGQLLQPAPAVAPSSEGSLPFQGGVSAPGSSPQDPTAGMSALQAARYRLDHKLPVSAGDIAVLDAASGLGGSSGGGGGVTSSTTTSVRQNDSPELRRLAEERHALDDQSARNMTAAGNTEVHAAAERAQIQTQQADLLTQQAQQMQQRREQQNAQLTKMISDQQQAEKDYLKAAKDIDPNRLLKGGNGVMAAIALGLGSMGATLGRTENFAQKIIDDKITRDVDAQKTALGAKREHLTMMQQAFQQYRAMFGDDEAALAATQALGYRATAAKLDANASKLQGTEKQAGYLAERDRLLAAANDRDQQRAQMLAGSIQRSTTTQAGGGGPQEDFTSRLTREAKAAEEVNKANGSGGTAITDSDRTKYNEASTKAADWVSALKMVDTVAKKTKDVGVFGRVTGRGSTDANALAVNQDALEEQLTKALTGASASPQQVEHFKHLVRGGVFEGSEGAQKRLNEVRNFVLSQVQGHMGAVHPELQAQYLKRLKASGMSDELIRDIGLGQTRDVNAEGAAAGFR